MEPLNINHLQERRSRVAAYFHPRHKTKRATSPLKACQPPRIRPFSSVKNRISTPIFLEENRRIADVLLVSGTSPLTEKWPDAKGPQQKKTHVSKT
jgi:hypothetical protein